MPNSHQELSEFVRMKEFESATCTLHGIQVVPYLITVHEVKDTSRQEPTSFTESIPALTDMDIMETEFTLSP